MRRLAGVLLVALTLFAAAAPNAIAQAPVPPEPTELWRQFPLDSAPRNQQAPPEPSSAPSVSPSTSRPSQDEGQSRTVQIAAIVLTLALVLILTTGMLAYATQRPVQPRTALGLRRWFQQTGDAPRAPRTGRRGGAKGFGRRLTGTAAAYWRRTRTTLSSLRQRSVQGESERSANELANVRQTLDTLTSCRETTTDEELDKLKAKLDVPSASTGLADDQLEILKAKRGKGAVVNVEPRDEVTTLKAKLARTAVDAEEEAPVAVHAGGSDATAGEHETRRAANPLARSNTGG